MTSVVLVEDRMVDQKNITPVLSVNTVEGSFKNKDGLVLFTRQWRTNKEEPTALIFISHGFGEHSGRYSDFLVPALVAEGFLVFSHDHVGHGQSDGERAQIDSFETYVRDVYQHIDEMAAKYPSLPVFLFGHSMGGAIAILTAMERPKFFTGVVLSAPAIELDPKSDTKCMRCLGRLLLHIAPSTQVIAAIDPAVTCRNSDKVEEYRTDLLVWHEGIKVGWGLALAHAVDKIQANIANIDWPFIVLHGSADNLTMVDGSVQLEQVAKSSDKTIKIYEGYYHELLNEPRKYSEVVKSDIIEWLRKRLPGGELY
ncbi:monoglyceride lipase-like [Actinia tenebrosa]|uniref:Monoglyceride lipase-like n=1 Tax=Actinia tenebrosa TaxID=6105 RepID=A0A6P8IQG9_ACTTE|nr:monoglyceride lipase-like [Actinia tenebrosa]